MSPHAVSRRLHRLNLGNYTFMHDFLTQQWLVEEHERQNSATLNNASIDVVWDSFQCFLDSIGYPREFCSKILLGKLLREAGVEKVKRGPRRRQKFYYFPLRPVKGSRAEAIMAAKTDSRYVACQTASRPPVKKECSRLCDFNVRQARGPTTRARSSHLLSKTTSEEQGNVLEKYDCEEASVAAETEVMGNSVNNGYNVPDQSAATETNGALREAPKEFTNVQYQALAYDSCGQFDSPPLDETPADPHVSRAKDHDEGNSSFSDMLVQSLSRLYDMADNSSSCVEESEMPYHHLEGTSLNSSSNGIISEATCDDTQTTSPDSPLEKHGKTFVHDGLVQCRAGESFPPLTRRPTPI